MGTDNLTSWWQAEADSVPGLAALYHENSKIRRYDLEFLARISLFNEHPLLKRALSRPYKEYGRCERVLLPRDVPPIQLAFDSVVLTRRSQRPVGGRAVTLPNLSQLLLCGNGISGGATDAATRANFRFRTAPSGGALYPIETYVFALRVESFRSGLYHYNPLEHSLEELGQRDYIEPLTTVTAVDVASAAAAFVLTAVFRRSSCKYGERAYRFVLMEAGHIAQNMLLTCTGLNLDAVPVGGFIDDELHEILGIDGVEEAALYVIVLG